MDFELSEEQIAQDIDLRIADITTESPRALTCYLEGGELYNDRKFKESMSILLKAVELDPGFAMAHRKISINCNYLRDSETERFHLDKAVAYLDRVSEREKYLIQGYYAQLNSPSLTDALKHYQDLIDLYPDDIDGNIQYGSVLRNMEEWEKASLRFDRILQVDKNNVLAHHNKAGIFEAHGLYDKARDYMETNRQVFSQRIYHRQMSLLYLSQGDLESAISYDVS